MRRNHWIMVAVLFVVLILALNNPPGAGHLVTSLLQGIDSAFKKA